MAHSKTPWRIEKDESGDTSIIDADGENVMCDMQYYPWCPEKETMEFIVEAANAHDRLIAERDAWAEHFDAMAMANRKLTAERNQLRAACEAVLSQRYVTLPQPVMAMLREAVGEG